MANQEIHEPKDYSEELRKLLTTDPAHADTFNPLFERLINNDVFMKTLIERLIQEHDHSGTAGKGSKIPYANIDVPSTMGGGLVTAKDLQTHANARNPHGTTASDVGAPTKEEFTEHKADDTFIKHKAKQISFVPPSGITATNVQDALLEGFLLGNSRKSDLVDKLLLVDTSLPISYESNWTEILNAVSMISTGKKWATGSVDTIGANSSFKVTGLSFTPSIVIVSSTRKTGTFYNSTASALVLHEAGEAWVFGSLGSAALTVFVDARPINGSFDLKNNENAVRQATYLAIE